jgi:hypothetical protein
MTKKIFSILTPNAFNLDSAFPKPTTTFAIATKPEPQRAAATGFSVHARTAPKRVQSFAARRRHK